MNAWTRYSLNHTNPEMFPPDCTFDKAFLCWWDHRGEVNKWVINDDFTYEKQKNIIEYNCNYHYLDIKILIN